MNRILCLLICCCFSYTVKAQFCGLESNFQINNFERQRIPLEIAGFSNNDLSDPAQGVCGISIDFQTLNVTFMEFWLVSPNGDSIELIGDILPIFLPSLNVQNFDIEFLPSSQPVSNPHALSPRWDNTLNNYGFTQVFTGTFYPRTGQLEDFNTGPVNGTWELVIETTDISRPTGPYDNSFVRDIDLIFCDDSGNTCCFPDGGTLDFVSVEACQGNAASLSFTPIVINDVDETEYGYTFLISDQDGNILEQSDNPDMSTYAEGDYQICGISYRLADVANLPTVGSFTIDSLRANLLTDAAVICADLTLDCIEVTINAPSDTTFLDLTICDQQSFDYEGNTFTVAGTYNVNLQNRFDCDSVVVLDLTFSDTLRSSIDQTICQGDSLLFGGSFYQTAGTFFDTLASISGCDSVSILNLSIIPSIVNDTAVTICIGDSVTIGTETFRTADTYDIAFPGSNGCDSIVRLSLTVLDEVQAGIEILDTITCNQSSVVVNVDQSTPAGIVTYEWTDTSGTIIGDQPLFSTSYADSIFLTITQTLNGTTCVAEASSFIQSDTIKPNIDLGTGEALNCNIQQITIGTLNTSQESDVTYQWSTTNGNIISGNTNIQAQVDAGGDYQLLVRKMSNGCVDSATVSVVADTIAPVVGFSNPTVPQINCYADSAILATTLTTLPRMSLDLKWEAETVGILDTSDLRNGIVFAADTYRFIAVDTINGCSDTASITVIEDFNPPVIDIATITDTLSCGLTSLVIDATNSENGIDYSYSWQGLNGGNVVTGGNTLTPTVDTSGTYRLTIQNLINGCIDSSDVEVIGNYVDVEALIVGSNDLSCLFDSVTLDAKGSFPNVGGTYQWSTIDGNILSPPNLDVVQINQAGTYQVVVQDIASQCSDSINFEVTIDTLAPVVEAGPGFALTCTTPSAPLNSSGSSSGVQFSYQWTGPCIVSGENTPAPTVDCGGTYILTITNMNNGCIAIDSVIITEDLSPPLTDAGPNDTLNCFNPVLTLVNNSVSGVGIDYLWSGPGFITSNTIKEPTIDQAGTYILTINNTINGCNNMDTVVISLDTLQPIADAGIDQRVDCNQPIVTLGGINTSIGAELRYTWSTNDGRVIGDATQATIQTDSAGTFQLLVENVVNGCVDSSSVVITFDQEIPITDAGPDQTLDCATETVTLGLPNLVEDPNVNYQWTGPDCFISPSDIWRTIVNCEGTYVLSSINSDNGCSATDTVIVNLDVSEPSAIVPSDTVFLDCATGEAELDGSNAINGVLGWYDENRNLLVEDVPTLSVFSAGTYRLIVSDTVRGCVDSTDITVILDCPVVASVASPELLTCDQESVLLDATGSITGTTFNRYEWTADDNVCIVNGRDSVVAEVICSGFYTLVVTNRAVNISDTVTVFVGIDTIAPRANAGLPDTLTCFEPTATLDGSASSIGLQTDLFWTTFDGDTISRQAMVDVDSAGVYILEVKNTDNGCFDRASVAIVEDQVVPQIVFGNSIFPCEPDSLILEAFINIENLNYTASWSGPGIRRELDSLRAVVVDTGFYELTIFNLDNGCSVTESVQVVGQDCPPCVEVITPEILTCSRQEVALNVNFCEPCTNCSIIWTDATGNNFNGNGALVANAGRYTLTVLDNTTGLATVQTIEVIEDVALPNINLGSDLTLTCEDTTLVLANQLINVDSLTYQWNLNSDPFVIGTSEQLEISVPGDYRLEITNQRTGCINVDNILVTIDTVPPMSNAGTDQSLTCSREFARLEGENSSSGANISYNWSVRDGGNIISGETSPNPIVDLSGTYILATRDDDNGCIDLDTAIVFLDRVIPNIEPIVGATITCDNPTVSIDGNQPMTGNFSGQWCEIGPLGNTINCQNGFTLTASNTGTYRFELTNDDNGCTNASDVIVDQNVETATILLFAPDDLNCISSEVTITGSVISDTSDQVTLNWLTNNGNILGLTNTPFIDVNQPGFYILEATTASNGCTSVDSIEITRNEILPSLSIPSPRAISCIDSQSVLNVNISATGANFSILWSTQDGNIVGDSINPQLTVNQAGSYFAIVTDLDNGCSNTTSAVVIENFQAPEFVIDTSGGTLIDCNNPFISIPVNVVQNSGSIQYFQGFEGNYSTIDPGVGDFILDYAQGFEGEWSIYAQDLISGCFSDTTVFVVRSDLTPPDVNIQTPGILSCSTSDVLIDASLSSNGPTFNNQWFLNGTEIMTTDLSLSANEEGIYRLVITDSNNGCVAEASTTVSVDTVKPEVLIDVPELVDCESEQVRLDATQSDIDPNYVFTWEVIDGGTIISGVNEPVVIVDSTGLFQLTIVNTVNGCEGEGFINVDDVAQPIEEVFFSILAPTCDGSGTGGVRIDSVRGGLGPYVFAVDSDFFVTQDLFEQLVPDTHLLKVLDSRGCTLERTFVINPTLDLEVELGPDVAIDLGDSIRIEALVSRPYNSLIWSPSDDLLDPTLATQILSPLETTVYTVTATDSLNCTASDNIIVTVNTPQSFFIPT
ncbi:MAG: hypothetical protein AAFO07_06775, partial [Bacteroidota bacterium]